MNTDGHTKEKREKSEARISNIETSSNDPSSKAQTDRSLGFDWFEIVSDFGIRISGFASYLGVFVLRLRIPDSC